MTRVSSEAYAMQLALDLAANGIMSTDPNPCVGCLVVQGDEVVGQGYHVRAGEAHAERVALAQAGEKARGATVYVTLEPCCHQGRTPPCTDALIDAGVSKVVAAMRDPNPLVTGGGFDVLRSAGIEVNFGLLDQPARWLNRGFITRMQYHRPWVALLASDELHSASEQAMQYLRSTTSAILTDIDNVLQFDPSFVLPEQSFERQPYRVLLDKELALPLDAKILTEKGRLIVFTLSEDDKRIDQLLELGVDVIQQDTDFWDVKTVLEECAEWQFNRILVEAQSSLGDLFLQSNLIDEVALPYSSGSSFVLPKVGDSIDLPKVGSFQTQEIVEAKQLLLAVDANSLQALYNYR